MSKQIQDHKTNDVDAALADYMRRVDAGQTVDHESFIAEYPQLADELREFLDSAGMIERMAGPPLVSAEGNVRKTSETQATGVGDSVPNQRVRQTQVAPGDLPPGPFGRYEIVKRLGRGAMGAVYLARDTQLDRQVALKTPTFDTNTDTEMVERFSSEAKAAAKLQHPGICAIHDVGEIDGTHFISMAYIDGKPLSGLINVDRPLPIRTVVSLVRKLAIALDEAHRGGVIHRDLKPENIMIDRQKKPVIMDFGLARQVGQPQEARLTQVGTILGTPAYMSPEQVEGKLEAGKKSDIYSLGVIFYELLCGNLPFSASIPAIFGQILTQSPLPLSQQRTEIDSQIESICRKMMARNAGDRYESMAEVANVLTDYLKGRAPNASQNQPPPATESAEHAAGRPTSSSQQSAATQTVTESEGLAGFLDAASQDELPVLATRHDGTFKQLAAPLKAISPRNKVIAASLCAGLLLVMGIVVMLRTPYGTLQLEVDDPHVTVQIDDKTIELTDHRWNDDLKAGPHKLAVLVGETPIPLGEATTVSLDGERRTVGLSVSGVELSGDKFVVNRGDKTAVTISLILIQTDGKQDDSIRREPSTRFDADILITPKSAAGYGVGQISTGEYLELNYLSGKWKGWGRHATESPDSRKQEQGDRSRLAICEIDAKGANRVLQIVPPGTAKRPFQWKADRHYKMVVLRINDSDGKFSSNPGSGVRYRLKILSGGEGRSASPKAESENGLAAARSLYVKTRDSVRGDVLSELKKQIEAARAAGNSAVGKLQAVEKAYREDNRFPSLPEFRRFAELLAIARVDMENALTAAAKEAALEGNAELAKSYQNELQQFQAAGKMILTYALRGTKWKWSDKHRNRWFVLRDDGSVEAGWHRRKGSWKVESSTKIRAVIEYSPRTPRLVSVDLSAGTLLNTGRGCAVHIIRPDQPKPSLNKKDSDLTGEPSANTSRPGIPEYAAFATGKWIPVLAKQADLAKATVHSGEMSRVPRTWMVDSSGKVEGLTIEKGVVQFSRDMIVSLNRYQANNLITRATVRNLDIKDLNVSLVWPQIQIVSAFNKGEDNFGMRLFSVWNVGENCFRGWQPFGFASRPQRAKEFEFAIARLGGRARAYVNGRMIQEFGISPHLPQCAPGLGTAKGSSSFRNIEVQILDDEKITEIDVNSPIVSRGKWDWEGNDLVLASSEDDTGCILFGNPTWTDYDFQAEVKADESRVAQLLFLAESTLQFSAAFVSGKQDEEGRSLLAVESHHPVREGYRLDVKGSPLAALDVHAWHTIRVSVRGKKCSVAVNGGPPQTYDNRLHTTNDNNLTMWQHSANRVGFRTWKGSARYRNFKVTSPDGKLLFSDSDLRGL